MIKNCQELVNSYIEWLRQKITVENINGICEITTPFLDRHNDHMQIYVKKTETGIILTDDGYIINDLRLSGCEFNTEKRKQMLHSILNGFGINLDREELIIETKIDHFPQKKHDLLQAMLSINDLFVLSAPTIASLFREDVERFLRSHEIRFTPTVKFTGKSGLDHSFDFVIPASKEKPERIMRTINNPTRQNISLLIFSWTEIAEVREKNSTLYGVLNDLERKVNPDFINALKQYNINTIQWSHKEDYIKELAI